jgi:hypothetical protein
LSKKEPPQLVVFLLRNFMFLSTMECSIKQQKGGACMGLILGVALFLLVVGAWRLASAPERRGIDVKEEIIQVLVDGNWWGEVDLSHEIDVRFCEAGLSAPRISTRVIRSRALELVGLRRVDVRLGKTKSTGDQLVLIYRLKPGGRRKAQKPKRLWASPVPSYGRGAILLRFFYAKLYSTSVSNVASRDLTPAVQAF